MNYTFEQQVFCLNALSNRSSAHNHLLTTAAKIAEKTKADLEKVLNDDDSSVGNIQKDIGVWKLVWGPQVVAYNGKALNTMYIAVNEENEYVVAIAGTDMTSIKDWLSEDFKVKNMVPWPLYKAAAPAPMISEGTSTGLSALLSMKDVDQGHTALAFFNAIALTESIKSITVTGHSLGGALSPVFALYLYEAFAQKANIAVMCNPAAGPTPGDAVFAAYYDGQLGNFTQRIWNDQDVIPHAWDHQLMDKIKALYSPAPKCPDVLKGIISSLQRITAPNRYTHVVAHAPSFTTALYPHSSDVKHLDFINQLKCQHICAYADYYKIKSFQLRVQQLLKTANPYFSAGCGDVNVSPAFLVLGDD